MAVLHVDAPRGAGVGRLTRGRYRWLCRAVRWGVRTGSWSGTARRLGVPLRALRERLRRYRRTVGRLLRREYGRQERAEEGAATAEGAEIARLLWQTVASCSVEQLRAEWEERFQRECACRRLAVPGEKGPEEYWLQPGYSGPDAVGWTWSDPAYQEHVRRRRQGWIDYHQVGAGRGPPGAGKPVVLPGGSKCVKLGDE